MIKIFRRCLSIITFCSLIYFSLILALNKEFSYLTIDGIKLWLAFVVPSLFPYFFITAILSSMSITSKITKLFSPITKKVFNVNGAVGYAFFMSLLSGYPVGAKIVCDLKESGVIGESESVRASALCSTSSPMFLIGSVGGFMFNNYRLGLILFISHLLSAILIGIIFSFYKRKDTPKETAILKSQKFDNFLYESAYSSVISLLVVGAIITIFYILSNLLFSLNILNPIIYLLSFVVGDVNLSKGLIFGLFECTQGLKILSSATALKLPLCAFVCGFSGVSIIMQSLAYLKKAKIKTAPFLLSKLLSAVLNSLFCFIICLFV